MSDESKKLDEFFDDFETNTEEKTSIVQGGTFSRRLKQVAKIPPSLVLLMGPAGYVGRQWSIDNSDIIIGRSMTSTVFIDARSVSKSHAKLTVSFGEVAVIDLDSTNKTVVNGMAIPPFVPKKLTNNDQVKIGNVLFKFLEEGSIEGAATQQLQEKSERDPLTKIWNKGALLVKGPEFFKRAKLLEIPLSLLVFDLDHFKNINDNFSHQAGDYVLEETADIIQSKLIRNDDYFARFGGEEFVILLFGSNTQQAEEIGERIRATIDKHQFNFEGKELPVTISIGIASQEAKMSSFDELFAKADSALYASKNSGRNRVTTL
ncbi:MAG: GGDEF domain-containing protein [Bdellovibrionales bacterium]|nr:GGDEF domain-containing protein [Bdellovibrionales bacterium]NQZ17887.1 GGDEF domain-containing protein [Bdellovibrionales bacterium]